MSDQIITNTPLEEIPKIFSALKETYDRDITRSIDWRLRQVRSIRRAVLENRSEIMTALRTDLNRCDFNATFEIELVIQECDIFEKNLSSWLKPQQRPLDYILHAATFSQASVVRDPLGVCLNISPWNFPILLVLKPLVGQLACGNTVMIKPSELSPASSALIQRLVQRYLDSRAVQVVQGDAQVATEVLKLPFNHILYTGNGTVAKIVMAAAAKHLTPVVLELGGKNPVYIDENVNMDVACRRIAYGKTVNCGQVCLSPDYALVHEKVADAFIAKLKQTLLEFYGQNPQEHKDYERIINTRHWSRIKKLVESVPEDRIILGGVGGGGGDDAEKQRYIAPTLILDPPMDSALMQEEIFGPILPIITVRSSDEAIKFIREREKPLALYIFSTNTRVQQSIIERTSSGSATINDCTFQFTVPSIPFGGVGGSGMGHYGGRYSFESFTHEKAVYHQSNMDVVQARYPSGPYNLALFKLFHVTKAKLAVWILSLGMVPLFGALFAACASRGGGKKNDGDQTYGGEKL